jgi:hypothetical protein
MENISIYSEARNEYLKQLSTWIVPPLVEFFRDEYERMAGTEGRGVMRAFQGFCAEVPRWNQDVIDANINKVLDNCRCDYIEELMTAVFIAHTKMLTAIRVSTKQKKLSITLPKLDHFLHRVFTECARAFWKAPFLFGEGASAVERQKNVLQAESLCIDALSGAVRSLLPVKNILRDYLDESDSDEESATVASATAQSQKKKQAPAAVPDSDSSSDEEEAAAPATPLAEEETGPFSAKPLDEPIESEELGVEPVPEAPAPVVIEKLETPPSPPQPTVSKHEVKEIDTKTPVTIEKLDTEPASADPPKLLIDTEPAVHFTPYDTVFDETTPGISEIRYTEKVSVEDKPPSNWGVFDDDGDDGEEAPRLSISNESASIGLDDIEDLDAPAGLPSGVSAVLPEEEVDEPLGTTMDFESLE